MKRRIWSLLLVQRMDLPINWHFLSVTIDPEFDPSKVLKADGARHGYDAARWSFLTGPTEKIAEFAELSGVTGSGSKGVGTLSHNFNTLIVDAEGRLRAQFPVSGNLSAAIVDEMVKVFSN